MRIFASSDHHFYHKNIIKYANRPFDVENENCVIDCAKHMIQKHNETVTNDDIALIVGDLACNLRGRQDHFGQLLGLLNGKKILVRGNHDYETEEWYKAHGFIDVVDYIEVGKFFISHYPCYESRWIQKQEKDHLAIINRDHCEVVIHGHVHNKNPDEWETDGLKRINVCVDFEPNGFKPVLLDYPELTEYFQKYK